MAANRRLLLIFAAAGLLLVFLANVGAAPRLILDDAFVYTRYVQNALHFGSLSWNPGEPAVDGYTSFGHLLIVWVLSGLTDRDPLQVAWAWCLFAGMTSLVLVFLLPLLHHRTRRDWSWLLTWLVGGVFVAGAPFMAYWVHTTMDMMTMGLAVLVSSWCVAVIFSGKSWGLARNLLLGLGASWMSWTRPEGFLVTVVLHGLVLAHRNTWARSWLDRWTPGLKSVQPAAVWAWVVVCWGYFLIHWAVYEHPLPNPVYVKTAGVSLQSVKKGVEYLWQGPGQGRLPMGKSLNKYPFWVDHVPVKQAISVDQSPWPGRVLLGMFMSAFGVCWWRRAWQRAEDAQFSWWFMLAPMGVLGLIILSGGDDHYTGWRLAVHMMPGAAAGTSLTLLGLKNGRWKWAVAAILLLLMSRHVVVNSSRKALCRKLGTPYGLQSLIQPVSLINYAWDSSHAEIDHQVADALEHAFSSLPRVGQSDYLRIAALYPGPVEDLSGLVNAEIAHRPHPPAFNLFQTSDLVDLSPDVYIWGFRFVDPFPISQLGIHHPDLAEILYPWPWPDASDSSFLQVLEEYRAASIPLHDGRFFNLLVHQRAVHLLAPDQTLILVEQRPIENAE
ncbi:MAG: hypothetical protein KDC35_03975 [Acidobacteria bacterium]|nr:hypothetical protein [Acidobacteriota bacterium]